MLLFISESPGPAVPDSAFIGGTHRFICSVPWSARLHQAPGEAGAPRCTAEKPPGMALKAKRSQLSGGYCGHGA